MWILQELFYTGIQTIIIIYTDPIILGLMHIHLASTQNEYKHTPVSLLHKQDPKIIIHNSDLVNLIPCELDLAYTTFFDATIVTYEL